MGLALHLLNYTMFLLDLRLSNAWYFFSRQQKKANQVKMNGGN